jgi:hypothetical protein
MAEKYFFEEKNAKKAASKARTTARQAAENRKPGAFTAGVRANLKKELSKGGKLDKAPARSKSGASTVAAVAKRFGVTAREARDIATAIGTMAQTATSSKNPQSKGPSGKNLIKQVKETAVAAATGKKGTTSDKVPYTGSMTAQYTGRYSRGTKRK